MLLLGMAHKTRDHDLLDDNGDVIQMARHWFGGRDSLCEILNLKPTKGNYINITKRLANLKTLGAIEQIATGKPGTNSEYVLSGIVPQLPKGLN